MTEYTGFKPTVKSRVPLRAGKALTITVANSPGAIAASNTAASNESTNGGPFNLSGFDATNGIEKRYVSFLINANIEFTVDLGKGAANLSAVTAAEVVAALLANRDFARYCTAAVTSTTKVTITTLALGTNAKFLARNKGANTVIAWATSAQSGTQAASAFQLNVYDGNGELAQNAEVRVRVYDASTAGSLLDDTYVQMVSKGAPVTGLHTNDAVLLAKNGELDFEIAANLTGADQLYIDLQPNVPGTPIVAGPSRTNIAKSS